MSSNYFEIVNLVNVNFGLKILILLMKIHDNHNKTTDKK
jgi:hypothetical protein